MSRRSELPAIASAQVHHKEASADELLPLPSSVLGGSILDGGSVPKDGGKKRAAKKSKTSPEVASAVDSEQTGGIGPGSAAVTLMLRSGLFAFCRSRVRNTTPAPQEFFRSLARILRESLADDEWSLPSLAACLAVGGMPTPTPPKKPRVS